MDEVAEHVKRSTAAQGLPERLEDPAVIAAIVAMLGDTDMHVGIKAGDDEPTEEPAKL